MNGKQLSFPTFSGPVPIIFFTALKSSYFFILYDLQERPLLLFTQMDGKEPD